MGTAAGTWQRRHMGWRSGWGLAQQVASRGSRSNDSSAGSNCRCDWFWQQQQRWLTSSADSSSLITGASLTMLTAAVAVTLDAAAVAATYPSK